MVIEPAFNDAHFHSPKHVWERNAPKPEITSPPPATAEEKALDAAEKKAGAKPKAAAAAAPAKVAAPAAAATPAKVAAPAAALTQKDDDKAKKEAPTGTWGYNEGPEKVHLLEPDLYKASADQNKPAPRTTFYA